MRDFAIIGSGPSGGRIAFDLVSAGASCVLLEAGEDLGAADFPLSELEYSTRLFWGGGLEITKDGRAGLLRGKVVGGTSVLNQALLDPFDDDAWDDWRDRSGVTYFTTGEMQRHYDAVLAGVTTTTFEREQFNRNAEIFTGAFDRTNLGWAPLHRGQSDCALDHGSDCIACLGGCPRSSKQSSLVTTIARARAQGLEVRAGFEVARLEHHADRVVVRGVQGGAGVEVTARTVVLAAGAVGNVGILLRSGMKDSLPALGTGFACHPQYMTYALFDEPVDAHKGAFQTVKSHDPCLRRAGLKLENVFAPPIGTAMLLPGTGKRHQKWMREYRHMASMEVAIRDEATGTMELLKDGRVLVDKRLTGADRAKVKDGLARVRGLFEQAGAREVIACPDTIGLHLMGGCAIGADEATSVVGPDFRVHGYPNLVAADSSTFPAAPGINPSLTVMALSHRCAEALA